MAAEPEVLADSAMESGGQAGDNGTDAIEIEEVEADSKTPDDEMARIDLEKKDMSAEEKLETSFGWKLKGNEFFKAGDIVRAADAYYHAVLYSKELTQNPKYYPSLGHNENQYKIAKELLESCFTNMALTQLNYTKTLAVENPERERVLNEVIKCAGEALRLNAANLKALYRRGAARFALAKASKNGQAQDCCAEAKADFMKVIQGDPKNKDARQELQAVQEKLKALKREEVANERKEFSFASTLSALSEKSKDLMGDGSIKKELVKSGDGGNWFNQDWLQPSSRTRCIVHLRCKLLTTAAPGGEPKASTAKAVALSFVLGEADMHEAFTFGVKSMTMGEVAKFQLAPSRMCSQENPLIKLLPPVIGHDSEWELAFVKYVTWEDLFLDGQQLQKIQSEGYGEFPAEMAEVHCHWRVFGAMGELMHSTRYTMHVGDLQGGQGLQHVEDEDKPPVVYMLGKDTWAPVRQLCKGLRQGGTGELRLRTCPPLPKDESKSGDVTSAQISMMLNKVKAGESLPHVTVRLEVERVVQPLAGPKDPRWDGPSVLVQERFQAEQQLARGDEAVALTLLRRVLLWAEQCDASDKVVAFELIAARASIGWILARRAAPILDLGNVTSDVLAVANNEIREADSHCCWLEDKKPEYVGTKLLRAKILVAQDDDFAAAQDQLLAAQRLDPNDARVQSELRQVKLELRKVEESEARARVEQIRDGLKRARTEGDSKASIVHLLQELSTIKITWETVMETRIGVELKNCQEVGDDVKALCCEMLGRLKDETKEQRPMWES